VGGVRVLTCVGGRVRFLNGVQGLIHMEKLEDLNRVPSFDQLFIDIGAKSRAEVTLRVGAVACFERPYMELGDRLVSKAMDDRISVAILIETMRRISEEKIDIPHRVSFVFSVQEEVGVRGATTAAFGIDPDLGLAVDVTGSGDTPKGLRMEVSLGKGPAIKVRDAGMLADPRVVDWMIRTAEEAGLPYQLEVLEAGGTDARAIQLNRSGVPAGCLSIPCRYIHSPSEMVDFNDVQNAVALMVELLRHPVELR
jgi:tetrahedral aminopeptidase